MESGRISVFLYNKGEANLIQVMSELRDPDRYVQRLNIKLVITHS